MSRLHHKLPNPCQPLVGQLAHADSLSPSAAAARQLPLGDSMRLKVHDVVSLDGKSATCDMAHLTRTGSHVDAKNVTHYVAKYMAKDAHAMAETASAFFLAKKHTEEHDSIAADSETSIRKAQYLLTNTINRIEGAIELSQDLA